MPANNPPASSMAPFVIALVALAISVGTSVWTLSQSRTGTDVLRSGAASAYGPARPSVSQSSTAPQLATPRLVMRSASATVNASGTVTDYGGIKPKVEPVALSDATSQLADALGPLLAQAGGMQKGLWCLSGGAWSIKDIATKKSGGAFIVDASQTACGGVFVASFDIQDGSPLPFSVSIFWSERR